MMKLVLAVVALAIVAAIAESAAARGKFTAAGRTHRARVTERVSGKMDPNKSGTSGSGDGEERLKEAEETEETREIEERPQDNGSTTPTRAPTTENLQSLFWTNVSKKTQITLPQSLTALLSYLGYDNEAGLRSLTAEAIDKMQDFARRILSKKLSPTSKGTVFGFFSNDPQDFEILPGHRELLLEVAQKMKDTKILVAPGSMLQEGKNKEPKKTSPNLDESKKIISNIIDKALLRDFNLKNTPAPAKPLYILTLKDEYSGTILCQIDECANRQHKITITKSLKRPWSSQNFYRHVREIHFISPNKKMKLTEADKNREDAQDNDDSPDSPSRLEIIDSEEENNNVVRNEDGKNDNEKTNS